ATIPDSSTPPFNAEHTPRHAAGLPAGAGVTAPSASAAHEAAGPASSPDPADFPGSYRPRIGRIPILDLRPQLADHLFPAKSYEGDVVPFSAVAFREGHDRIGVELIIASPAGQTRRIRMHPGAPGTDRWETTLQPAEAGLHTWHVEAWADDIATWR